MVLVNSRQSSMTCSLSPSDNVENRDHCEGGSSTPSSSLCLIDLDMIAVRKRAQKPNFSYRWMCPGLWDQVKRPACSGPHSAKRSMTGSINRCPMPRFHRCGRTVNGPKNPTLPQLDTKLDPASSPSTSAAKAAAGAAFQRVRTRPASPMNVIGSGSPRKVPKARRMMRSASERSPSLNGRIETSGFTSTIGVLLSSTQPHQVASLMTLWTQKCGQDKACEVRQPKTIRK